MVSQKPNLKGNSDLRVLLYEGSGAEAIEADARFDALKVLLDDGYAVTRSNGTGQVAAHDDRAMVVVGRFDDNNPLVNADADSDIALHIHQIEPGLGGQAIAETANDVRKKHELDKPGSWKPWFPVIDFNRCTNCMQCLSFCLFDVYGVDNDQQIQVQNNSNCKTDCPACSRVCPEVAILFPKYRNGPINGDEISKDDVQREQMKVDISSLLGGDIYDALKQRSIKAKSRFAKERDEDKALKERIRCLKKLSEGMDIPAEVLSSLPTMDVIQKKATEAAAKAQDALDAQDNSQEANA